MLSVARTTAFRSRQSLAFLAMSLVMSSVPRPAAAAGTDRPIELLAAPDLSTVKGELLGERPTAPNARPAGLKDGTQPFGQAYAGEVEPNGTFATASPIVGDERGRQGHPLPQRRHRLLLLHGRGRRPRLRGDDDRSSRPATAQDSQLTLLASDGTTVIEFDDDNGSFGRASPRRSRARRSRPRGTYFVRVNDFTAGTTSERPYELHFRLQSGAPTPEVEANDTPATANPSRPTDG